jgi:hypothetical protein
MWEGVEHGRTVEKLITLKWEKSVYNTQEQKRNRCVTDMIIGSDWHKRHHPILVTIQVFRKYISVRL